MKRILLSVVVAALLSSAPISAQSADLDQLYRLGEVVVVGTPDDVPDFQIVKFLPRSGLTVVAVPRGNEWRSIKGLRARGLAAEFNYLATAFANVNDPLRSFQWHFDNVQANAAWDLSTGAGVTVAVLDSGLDPSGPDGLGCTVAGFDFANNDANPFDGDGHGTHVSGTIGQASNNNVGVAGLAYGCCVMPVKVLDDSGNGDFADIAEGVFYAVDNGAEVINMSLGTNARFGVTSIPAMDAALDYAYANGVTVVCASGNDGNRKNVSYPAIYPTTIAVGATGFSNGLVSYSNRGTGIDMVAPGGDLGADANGDGYADGVLQETTAGTGTFGYYFFQGTSMASPHVAAAAAMLIAHGTASTPDDVYEALTQSATGGGSWNKNTGYGLLQAHSALTYDPNNGGGNCTDADGDGFCPEDGDCDDTNPDVYPGANDTRGRNGRDGIDNDCNGIIDG
ncbi:MAG: S8 family serine peptidase [Planctomycetota bacterium]